MCFIYTTMFVSIYVVHIICQYNIHLGVIYKAIYNCVNKVSCFQLNTMFTCCMFYSLYNRQTVFIDVYLYIGFCTIWQIYKTYTHWFGKRCFWQYSAISVWRLDLVRVQYLCTITTCFCQCWVCVAMRKPQV